MRIVFSAFRFALVAQRKSTWLLTRESRFRNSPRVRKHPNLCDTIGYMPYKNKDLPENIEKARESRRKHYHNNKEPYIQRARAKTKELTDYVRALKESTPCKDCGVQYGFYAMQFDHTDSANKVGEVAKLSRAGSMKKLLEEIEKCEIVCANCHAKRTWSRLQTS